MSAPTQIVDLFSGTHSLDDSAYTGYRSSGAYTFIDTVNTTTGTGWCHSWGIGNTAWGGNLTNHEFKYDSSDQKWKDVGSGNPVYITGRSSSANATFASTTESPANAEYIDFWQSSNAQLFTIVNPYFAASGSGSGNTYIRTPHTSSVPFAVDFTLRPPDYETLQVQTTSDAYYRKLATNKFRLRWYDQNAPTSGYVASVYYQTQTGTNIVGMSGNWTYQTVTVMPGSGDVQWDVDTGTSNPVLHHGLVHIRFSTDVRYQGSIVNAGDLIRQWQYLGVGPFFGWFTPVNARPGEQATVHFRDDNIDPDTGFIGSYELPDGTSANIWTTTSNAHATAIITVQKGWSKIYEADLNHRGSQHVIRWHEFKNRNKVSSNFW